jgi:nitrite reductase/ring-hydroxylating ferredoxin subunit
VTQPVSRRIVFNGLGALGVAVALAGCAGADDGTGGGSTGGSPTAAAGDALVKTADVPVGGGVILTEQKIVVTQPTEGEFKAFTAVCTHQGFLVTSVADGVIMCNHHGSQYSAETGEVEGGPAPAALAEVAVRVEGDEVVAA